MTSPDSPKQQRPPMTDGWRSWWLMALAPVGLGAVILAAEASNGELTSGLAWFAVMAAVGAILAFGAASKRSVRLAAKARTSAKR